MPTPTSGTVLPDAGPAVSISSGPAPLRPPRTSSDRLFAGRRELEIEHAGAVYRLRITATGKLILTK